jgi:HD-GYP domain-containing protein (c-di-GMP phosphodiesterase class II)
MELAGLFLDIGLLALPGDLLAVRGPLRPEAVELLHGHPETSGNILEPLARVGVPVAAVRAHHERLDGSGYPRGLRGRQVPFGAQLLAVVDTWAALTRPRPHRPALADRDALAVLRQEVSAGRLQGKLVEALELLLGAGRSTDPPPPAERAVDHELDRGLAGRPSGRQATDGPPTVLAQPANGRLALSL